MAKVVDRRLNCPHGVLSCKLFLVVIAFDVTAQPCLIRVRTTTEVREFIADLHPQRMKWSSIYNFYLLYASGLAGISIIAERRR